MVEVVERNETGRAAVDGPVLALDGLVKTYGRLRALDGLTAHVPPGAVGLLGPNGAGKTTLIKVVLGLLHADAGTTRLAGLDPRDRTERLALRRIVGYMPESDCLIPGRTGIELVVTLGRVTGLSAADAMTRAHEVLDYVGLEEHRYRGLDQYSTGMKQRLKLAQALVHDPLFLLLDEPTNGLDPKGRRHMLELVHDLGHAQGKNVLFCSHLLPDVERTCEHIVVLHRGRAIAAGGIAELTRSEGRSFDVVVRGEAQAFERELGAAGLAFQGDGPGRFRVELPALEANADTQRANADQVFALADRAHCTVVSLEPLRSTLDDVFLGVLRQAEAAG